MGTFRRIILALAVGSLVSACAQPTGDCTEQRMPRVSGSWQGLAHLGVRGAVPITLNLNQHNECVNGAWLAEDETSLGGRAGAATGTVSESGQMELVLEPISWESCLLDAVLTLRDGTLTGSLRQRNCKDTISGNLELSQVHHPRETQPTQGFMAPEKEETQ